MALPDNPISRGEVFLNAVANSDASGLPSPVTRREKYLAAIAAGNTSGIPEAPLTREEQYLDYIAKNGGGGSGVTVEELSVTANGTYTAEEGKAYSPVEVTVPQTTVEALPVTENGTYTAPSGKAYSPVTVNVPAPRTPIYAWDFKSATPLVDTVRGAAATSGNVTFNANGAVFDSASDYLRFPSGLDSYVTIEIDVSQMNPGTGNGKRLVDEGVSNGNGLNWNYTGCWEFAVGSSTVQSDITDGAYFDGHTLKIFVDAEGKWHIYRDDTLVFEPNIALSLSQRAFVIGSSSRSIGDATFTAVRVY